MTLFVYPRPVGHVNLQPVRAVFELLSRRFAGFHWPVDDLHALWHHEFGSVTFQVVTAGGGNSTRRSEHARARNGSFLDGLLDADIAVARALGLDIAQCRKPRLERALCGISRSRGPQRDARLQYVRVVATLCRILAPQKKVCVRVDHSRKDRCAGKVNRLCAGRDGRRTVRDFLNPLAAHENQLILPRRLALSVNQRSRANHRQRRRFRFLRLRLRFPAAKHDEQEEQSKTFHTRSIPFFNLSLVRSLKRATFPAGFPEFGYSPAPRPTSLMARRSNP